MSITISTLPALKAGFTNEPAEVPAADLPDYDPSPQFLAALERLGRHEPGHDPDGLTEPDALDDWLDDLDDHGGVDEIDDLHLAVAVFAAYDHAWQLKHGASGTITAVHKLVVEVGEAESIGQAA